jgi:tetratricopeptide (TPR) repeat protein
MPEAADLVDAADALAEASLYTEAIETYTKAIALNPSAPGYYIKRFPPCLWSQADQKFDCAPPCP